MISLDPLLTDLYQLTMLQTYFDRGMHAEAVFELFVRRLPAQRNFLVAAGLEQALEYLAALRFEAEDLERLAATRLFSEEFLGWLEDFRFTGRGVGRRHGRRARQPWPRDRGGLHRLLE